MKSVTHISARLFVAAVLLMCSGCNLGLDLDEFPYQGPLIINFDAGNDTQAPPTDGGDVTVDLPDEQDISDPPDLPQGEPQLVITELLINTSQTSSGITGEVGEYVEIKNIGGGPADPRAISFSIENIDTASQSLISIPFPSSSEQVRIYGELKDIQPGEYFVFIRYQTDEVPLSDILETGTFFDWGRYGQDASLANGGERLLELKYFDGVELQEFDRVRWNNGTLVNELGAETVDRPLDEDVALSVVVGEETPSGNDAPENWCQETTTLAGNTKGTPGESAACESL